ncbi:hypothetical protein DMH04_05695 [Kibdelosporangium aridum]|uniref:Uncharacterized protein n=1 Tax=Kibdelosporangium aridum TaxID=2030 RepID=A0A428ZN69_KIBAR|nr:hypothetical protein DMH04_05695 [Kibdelosporangium aridum]
MRRTVTTVVECLRFRGSRAKPGIDVADGRAAQPRRQRIVGARSMWPTGKAKGLLATAAGPAAVAPSIPA